MDAEARLGKGRMWSRMLRGSAILSAVGAILMLGAPAVANPGGAFACRASIIRLSNGVTTTEANVSGTRTGSPCVGGNFSEAGAIETLDNNTVQVATSLVTTHQTLHSTPQDGDNATGQTTGQTVAIAIGSGPTSTLINADSVASQAQAMCSGGAVSLSTQSSVTNLSVNGTQTPSSGPQTISTQAGTLYVNEQITTAGGIEQRALDFVTNSGDHVVVGDATAGYMNSPCTNVVPQSCPAGYVGTPPNCTPAPAPVIACKAIAEQGPETMAGVANPAGSPCANGSTQAGGFDLAFETGTGAGLYAQTAVNPPGTNLSTLSAPYPNGTSATASSGATNIDVDGVTASQLTASVTATCTNGSLVYSGSGQASSVVVNNTPLNTTAAMQTYATPEGTLYLNWIRRTATSYERRAFYLAGPTGNTIIGDVKVSDTSNPC